MCRPVARGGLVRWVRMHLPPARPKWSAMLSTYLLLYHHKSDYHHQQLNTFKHSEIFWGGGLPQREGDTPSRTYPSRRLRRLDLRAFGAHSCTPPLGSLATGLPDVTTSRTSTPVPNSIAISLWGDFPQICEILCFCDFFYCPLLVILFFSRNSAQVEPLYGF